MALGLFYLRFAQLLESVALSLLPKVWGVISHYLSISSAPLYSFLLGSDDTNARSFFMVPWVLNSRRETLHSWQRSWGRRLGILKGRIEPQESPWIFLSVYPQKTRVCLLYCFVLSPLTLLGAVPHHHLALSDKELTYSSN